MCKGAGKIIDTFVQICYDEKEDTVTSPLKGVSVMRNYVIVIGRQFGSGGHEIGIKLAQKLGIPLYDKDILASIAQEQGITPERLHKMDEDLRGNHMLNMGLQTQKFHVFNPGLMFETDTSSIISRDQAFRWQAEKIRELADAGPCIIIGRCADYILREHPGLISVFITAPLLVREARIARLHPNHPRENNETYLEFIQKTDKARSSYYNYHTDRVWSDIGNYHLCIDSAKLGVDGTVEFLADYVKHAMG